MAKMGRKGRGKLKLKGDLHGKDMIEGKMKRGKR